MPASAPDLCKLTSRVFPTQALRQRLFSRAQSSSSSFASRITLAGSVVLAGLYIWTVQRTSFADLRLVLRPIPGQYATSWIFLPRDCT